MAILRFLTPKLDASNIAARLALGIVGLVAACGPPQTPPERSAPRPIQQPPPATSAPALSCTVTSSRTLDLSGPRGLSVGLGAARFAVATPEHAAFVAREKDPNASPKSNDALWISRRSGDTAMIVLPAFSDGEPAIMRAGGGQLWIVRLRDASSTELVELSAVGFGAGVSEARKIQGGLATRATGAFSEAGDARHVISLSRNGQARAIEIGPSDAFAALLEERDGGFLLLHHTLAKSRVTRLDADMRPLAERALEGVTFEHCKRAARTEDGGAIVWCEERIVARPNGPHDPQVRRFRGAPSEGAQAGFLRLDKDSALVGYLPARRQVLAVTAIFNVPLLLDVSNAEPRAHAEQAERSADARSELCVRAGAEEPVACFALTAPLDDRGDLAVDGALAVRGTDVLAAWRPSGGTTVELRALRCSPSPSASMSWQEPAGRAGPWGPVQAGIEDLAAPRAEAWQEHALEADAPPRIEKPPPPCAVAPTVPRLAPLEVTVGEYKACLRARACTPPAEGWTWARVGGDHASMTGVSREQAAAYCAFIGARLPTTAEWLAVARADCHRFPWGDDPFGGHSNCIANESGMLISAPGAHKDDVVRGVYDLHGNAPEWVSDGEPRGNKFCASALGEPASPMGVGIRCLRE